MFFVVSHLHFECWGWNVMDDKVNTKADGALASCIATSSATMVLAIYCINDRCLPWGKIVTTCATSMSSNDGK